MSENITLSVKKSSTQMRNNRKRTKVFDPYISNKRKKHRVEQFSDENDPILVDDQLAIIKKHLVSCSNKDLNKTLDKMCDELGLNKCASEDDLSDDPEANCSNMPRADDSVNNCINKIFEGLDDYAAFNPKGLGSTPKVQRNVYSAIDTSIKATPGITSFNLKSILKCTSEKRRNEIISKTPQDEDKSRSGLAQPIFETSLTENSNRTPLGDKTNLLKTPEPCQSLSDCVLMSSEKVIPYYSIPDSFYTPFRSTPHQITRKSLSPVVIELSPEIKKTLLVGVSCFVDVKTNKEDCSSSVGLELLSMGATVEKTFNKKVNHVVFKEGRPSTYLKAKKLGITLVSVLWLEACKKERKKVDPNLYPPINVEKYEDLSPNAKKIPTLKTIQRKLRKHLLREAGLLSTDTKTKVRINWGNTLTDIKMRVKSTEEFSQGRLCIKKLDFNKVELLKDTKKPIATVLDSPEPKFIQHEKENIENKDNSNGSSSYCQESPPAVKRKSAPAKLFSERKKRKRKEEVIPVTGSQNMMTIEQLFARQMILNKNKNKKLCFDNDNCVNSQSSTQVKKRKLFNPDEVIAVMDSPDEKATPPPVTYNFPYQDDEDLSNKKKLRTRSTSMKKIFKKMIVGKKPIAKKSLTSLLEQDESSNTTSGSRGSITYFMDVKRTEPKLPKEPPTIVCTSLLPNEERQISYIAGKLGVFDVQDKVSSRTTHLVTAAPRRTINLLKALVRGAWILHVEWVYKSEKAGHWLNEEDFELKTFSHAVTELRRERQAFGPEFCSELFSNCGPIYISKRSAPPCSDLTELVRLCKGRIVNNLNGADFVIGGKAVQGETLLRLKEKWILDSITQNTLLNTGRYIIKVQTS